jgi:hypothetical protein
MRVRKFNLQFVESDWSLIGERRRDCTGCM